MYTGSGYKVSNMSKVKKPLLKYTVIAGIVFGGVGAFLGFMAGMTPEGAAAGFLIGWSIGEIFAVAASDKDHAE